jgi:small conductance mechanosensitive channel
MDEFQARTVEMIDSSQAAVMQLSNLAVTYSFSILGAVIILIVGYFLSGLVGRSIYRALRRFKGFDETLRKFFATTARYAILVLVAVTVLAQFGVQTASIIAALGAAGLAIGLALQGTLQNIAAGIMLLALRPFRVGEAVDAGGISGTVQEIGLFATEMSTGDGVFMLVPNSQLWNTSVTNFSRNATRAHNLTFRIGYRDDIDKAQSIIRDIVVSDPRVLAVPAPHIYVSALADSAVNITMRYWTPNAHWWQAQLDFTKAVKQRFDAAGISIPLPQQEVRYVPTVQQTSNAVLSGSPDRHISDERT